MLRSFHDYFRGTSDALRILVVKFENALLASCSISSLTIDGILLICCWHGELFAKTLPFSHFDCLVRGRWFRPKAKLWLILPTTAYCFYVLFDVVVLSASGFGRPFLCQGLQCWYRSGDYADIELETVEYKVNSCSYGYISVSGSFLTYKPKTLRCLVNILSGSTLTW